MEKMSQIPLGLNIMPDPYKNLQAVAHLHTRYTVAVILRLCQLLQKNDNSIER